MEKQKNTLLILVSPLPKIYVAPSVKVSGSFGGDNFKEAVLDGGCCACRPVAGHGSRLSPISGQQAHPVGWFHCLVRPTRYRN